MKAQEEELLNPIVVSVAGFAVAVLLFLLRAHDINYTSSWRWVFQPSQLPFVALLALASAPTALLLLRLWGRRLPVLLAIASSLALLHVPEIVIDAGRYFTYAKYAEVYGPAYLLREWGQAINPWSDMPLVPLLYGMIFWLFGEERLYIQLFNALVFAGTVMLTGRLGRRMFGVEEALPAMLLLASPFLLLQPSQMMVDLHAMFFLTLAIYTTFRAAERPGVRGIAAASVAVALAFFTKYSLMLMLPSLALIYFTRRDRNALIGVSGTLLGAAVLVGIAFLLRHQVFIEQMELLRGFQMAGLKRWGESYFSTFFFQVHPFVTLSAAAGALLALRSRKPELLLPAYLFGLIFVLGVERIRYTMPLFPMLAVLAGYALSALSRRNARFTACYAVSFSLLVAIFAYAPFIESLSVVNLRDAGEYLDTLDAEVVEFNAWVPDWAGYNPAIILPILDLYTHKKLVAGRIDAQPPAPEQLSRSPVRFTWAYRLPPFYEGSSADVVVLVERQEQGAPAWVEEELAEAKLIASFTTRSELFIIRTLVKVYAR